MIPFKYKETYDSSSQEKNRKDSCDSSVDEVQPNSRGRNKETKLGALKKKKKKKLEESESERRCRVKEERRSKEVKRTKRKMKTLVRKKEQNKIMKHFRNK